MGAILGAVIGGIGSIIGASKQAKAASQAAAAQEGAAKLQYQSAHEAQQSALTGFNYLNTGAGSAASSQYINNGSAANDSIAQLLGQKPMGVGTQSGFNNYLGSTAYKFQMDQGTGAVSGGAASKGLLNSGGTAKALTQYGQNLAGTTFNNYLGQLSSLAGTGQNQLNSVAQAGTTGGSYGGSALVNGTAQAGNMIAGAGDTRQAGVTNSWTNGLAGVGQIIGAPWGSLAGKSSTGNV